MFRAPADERCPIDGARLHRTGHDPLIGTWFADRYLVEELVGDGPLGRVYRARAMPGSRLVALRVLAGEHAADPGARGRFQRQAELARRLDHPNVVNVSDIGLSREGLPYVVTEYVRGPALSQVVAREGPLDRERAVSILRQVASGLEHAHERGVLHRDLRPANVLLVRDRRDERALIVDFAIGAAGNGAGDARLDMAGLAGVLREMLGTAAPAGKRVVRARTVTSAHAEVELGRLANRLEAEPVACLRSLGLAGRTAKSAGAASRSRTR